MGGEKRNSSSSGQINDEDEADARLARRWKRRNIANQDFKVNFGGKSSSTERESRCNGAPNGIPEINCVEIDSDIDDNDVDSDYRLYLNGIDLEAVDDMDVVNCRNVDNGGDIGSDVVLVVNDDAHHNDAFNDTNQQNESKNVRFDVNEEGDYVDADYEKHFVSEALDSNIGECRSPDIGDTGGDRVVDDMLVNNDPSADEDPLHEAIPETDKDSDYEKFFSLQSSVDSGVDGGNFFNNGSDVNAVNGSVKNDSGADGLSPDIGNAGGDRVVYDIQVNNDTPNNDASADEDPLRKSIHKSDNIRNDDIIDSDYEKFFALESSVDSGVDGGNFFNNGSDVNAVNGSVKNDSGAYGLSPDIDNAGGDRVVNDIQVNNDTPNNDASADEDPLRKSIHKSDNIRNDDIIDSDYEKFFALESSVDSGVDGGNFFNNASEDNAVNGSTKNDSGADELVENASPNGYINNNNHFNASDDTEPQSTKIPESNIFKSTADKMDVDTALGPSGDDISVDVDGLRQSADNDIHDIWSTENAAVAGGSAETRSMNNDADPNDDLVDLQYRMFLKNLREDGKSFVLVVPSNDGISEIIKYEMDDRSHEKSKAENPKRTRPRRETAGRSKHAHKHETECDILDPSYKIFLSSLKKEGRLVVFTPESGPKVVYDEDESNSSDSEVIVMDSDPFSDEDYTPFVTSKPKYIVEEEGSGWIKGARSNDCSRFRKGLTEILRKPYNKEEFNKLWREASRCRRVTIDREMRDGRSRRYETSKFGDSYLDIHKELKSKINSASSKPKALNLLRGFFYWLKNVAHDGVFKPWMDSSSLEVLPDRL